MYYFNKFITIIFVKCEKLIDLALKRDLNKMRLF